MVSKLEIIQNLSDKQLSLQKIQECFGLLQLFQPKPNDETDLELHAELWARLGRLGLNEDTEELDRMALKCIENSLSRQNEGKEQPPPSRLRWYSLADYLYSETILRLVTPA